MEAARAAAEAEAAGPYVPLLPAWRQMARGADRDYVRNLKLELTTTEDQVITLAWHCGIVEGEWSASLMAVGRRRAWRRARPAAAKAAVAVTGRRGGSSSHRTRRVICPSRSRSSVCPLLSTSALFCRAPRLNCATAGVSGLLLGPRFFGDRV